MPCNASGRDENDGSAFLHQRRRHKRKYVNGNADLRRSAGLKIMASFL